MPLSPSATVHFYYWVLKCILPIPSISTWYLYFATTAEINNNFFLRHCKSSFVLSSTNTPFTPNETQMEVWKYHETITTTQSYHSTDSSSYEFLLCISCSSSSSFVKGIVEWLYNPCAISCKAKGFFWPDAFLIFARLFWNQILIWASFKPNSALSCCLRLSVK